MNLLINIYNSSKLFKKKTFGNWDKPLSHKCLLYKNHKINFVLIVILKSSLINIFNTI